MDKILNKKSNRFIQVNGQRYKTLVKQGYYVNKCILLEPTIINDIKNDIQKVFSQKVSTPILLALEPKYLLSLYITDKQFNYFNKPEVLNLLNVKYNKNAKSFTQFIQQYNQSLISINNIYMI